MTEILKTEESGGSSNSKLIKARVRINDNRTKASGSYVSSMLSSSDEESIDLDHEEM